MMRRLLMAAAAVALLVPGAALASHDGDESSPDNYLDYFHSPNDDGLGRTDAGGPTGYTLHQAEIVGGLMHLWLDPTTIQGGGISSTSEVSILANDGISITDVTNGCQFCVLGNPGDPTKELLFSITARSAGQGGTYDTPFHVFDVAFTGDGTFDLNFSNVFLPNFGGFPIMNHDAVARAGAPAPEPTAIVLLGLAMGSIAFVRRSN